MTGTLDAPELEVTVQTVSVLVTFVRQGYKMASAMPVVPEPNETWTYLQFFQRATFLK